MLKGLILVESHILQNWYYTMPAGSVFNFLQEHIADGLQLWTVGRTGEKENDFYYSGMILFTLHQALCCDLSLESSH